MFCRFRHLPTLLRHCLSAHVLVVGILAQKVTDDIHFPFQLEIIQKFISFSQELPKRPVICEVGPETLCISPSQPQCRKEAKIHGDEWESKREHGRGGSSRERSLVPAPASVYFNFPVETSRYPTHKALPYRLPHQDPLSPTPSRTNRQILPSGIIQPLLHLLPESRQSSARCPGDTLTPSCCAGASASFWFSRTGSWASVNAAHYLQVLAASLEELIKSILLLGLVWIHLLTSVSNISGMFILLSSWNTAYKVMKEMCTECTKENWVLL